MKNESLVGKFFKETLPAIVRKIIAFLQSIGARIASLRGKFASNRTKADPLVHKLLTSITMYMRKAIGVYSDLKGMGDKTQNTARKTILRHLTTPFPMLTLRKQEWRTEVRTEGELKVA